jgi:hypothetical protein
MANRLYNKQVSPKGYKRGGKVSSTKKKPYHDKTTAHKNVRHPHSRLKTQKEYKAITDSAEYKKSGYRKQNKMLAAHPKYQRGGHVNTGRENELEELGRVDAERAHTGRGRRNLGAEKRRIVRQLGKRGR